MSDTYEFVYVNNFPSYDDSILVQLNSSTKIGAIVQVLGKLTYNHVVYGFVFNLRMDSMAFCKWFDLSILNVSSLEPEHIKNTIPSDIDISSYKGASVKSLIAYLSTFCDNVYLDALTFTLDKTSYIDIYDSKDNIFKVGSSKVLHDELQESARNLIISNLSDKLDTLDNLNVLASADFSPLLNLSTFADLVGSLNPVLTKQVNALDVLNVYASTLQPVRAKFGQPVEPLSKTDKVYSFIDYNHMTINRLITNQSKNSKIYLYDVSSSKLLKVLYDIDYSMTFDVKDYKSLRIVFDANDYVIDKAL